MKARYSALGVTGVTGRKCVLLQATLLQTLLSTNMRLRCLVKVVRCPRRLLGQIVLAGPPGPTIISVCACGAIRVLSLVILGRKLCAGG